MNASVFSRLSALAATLDPGLDLLAELVNLDTPSGDAGAIGPALDILTRELGNRGFVVRTRTDDAGVPVLVADRGATTDAFVGLVGHVDTVFGHGEARTRPFTVSADGVARGPGVADMKGGLVTLLRCVDVLDRADAAIPLRIVANGDEEIGSPGSRSVLVEQLSDAACALVFEPGRPSGDLVSHRRGTVRFRLSVEGIAAHSGVAPRDGANAIHDLAPRIASIAALAQHHPECDVNVTTVTGGVGINTVPDQASCEVDVRTTTLAEDHAIRADVAAIAAASGVPGTSCRIEWLASRPPLERVPEQLPLLDAFAAAGRALHQRVGLAGTGGGSDGNLLNASHVPIIDGCGPVGANYHRRDELVHVATIMQRALLCAAALLVFTRGGVGDA